MRNTVTEKIKCLIINELRCLCHNQWIIDHIWSSVEGRVENGICCKYYSLPATPLTPLYKDKG